MNDLHIICPNCSAASRFGRNEDDAYICPRCGAVLYYPQLQACGAIVDTEKASAEYEKGQYYLSKRDYAMAEVQFDKVRIIDKTNFFAEYFYRISGIRAVSAEGKLYGAEVIMSLLTEPVSKMVMTDQPKDVKKRFLLYALTEVHGLLTNLLDGIERIYTGSRRMVERRDEYLMLVREVRALTVLDRAAAMLDDAEVGKAVAEIGDIAMHALQRVIGAKMCGTALDLPSKAQADEARTLYGVFDKFIKSVYPEYLFRHYKETLAENSAFTTDVLKKIDEYGERNRSSLRRRINVQSDSLIHLLYYCRTALSYTYHTVIGALGGLGRNESGELIESALECALESIKPRVFEVADKIHLEIQDFAALAEYTGLFNDLCGVPTAYKVDVSSLLENFYAEVYADISYHYSAHPSLSDENLMRARQLKNGEYFAYGDFLYGVVCASVLATTEMIAFNKHRTADRIKLLKLGHEAGERLSYLFDHKSSEMEKIERFAQLPKIFNLINTNLRSLA